MAMLQDFLLRKFWLVDGWWSLGSCFKAQNLCEKEFGNLWKVCFASTHFVRMFCTSTTLVLMQQYLTKYFTHASVFMDITQDLCNTVMRVQLHFCISYTKTNTHADRCKHVVLLHQVNNKIVKCMCFRRYSILDCTEHLGNHMGG